MMPHLTPLDDIVTSRLVLRLMDDEICILIREGRWNSAIGSSATTGGAVMPPKL